ncbi:hypothetical protein [uncultured Phocaeicola sp.]|uniref:hypothetical protein n=1 Tax=uncultured Phocaeicola sp. TaxID=990718 RepID=UPI001433BBDE|nr:hypothetical protein [uncultured Phocaeicola sp.]GFH99464.1 hypothetical protein IMSAGC004_01867 [Bacteroidaceae bacterium]
MVDLKKSLFYTSMACLLACLTFTSCSDDDEMENSDTDTEVEIDEVKYLQNSLIKVDENGKFLYRICGEPLDDADTTKLYLGVKDAAEAQARFRSFFPETTQFEENGQQVVARLKNNAGTVTFVKTDDEEEIARIEFSVSPSLHLVSSFHFLNENAWPDNGESVFVEGDCYSLSGKKYVCIRTKANGNPTLLLHISSSPSRAYVKEGLTLSNVTRAEANMVRDILLADGGRKFEGFQKYFQNAGTSLEKEESYWIGELEKKTFWEFLNYYAIHLADGKMTYYAPKVDDFRFWHIISINR